MSDRDVRDPIRIGGVLRCCIQTADEIAPPAGMAREGDTLACSYCSSGLVMRDGAWEWNRQSPVGLRKVGGEARDVIADRLRRFFKTPLPYGPADMILRDLADAGFQVARIRVRMGQPLPIPDDEGQERADES